MTFDFSFFSAFSETHTTTNIPEYTHEQMKHLSAELVALMTQSSTYYSRTGNAASDSALAVVAKEHQSFNIDTHKDFLIASTNAFQSRSQALRDLDKKIAFSMLTSIVASSLSFLPFVGLLSLATWSSTFYYIGQRSALLKEYNASLNVLVTNCNWSLGPKSADKNLATEESICKMMEQLYPVLTKEQLTHLINNLIEDIFVDQFEAQVKTRYDWSHKGSSETQYVFQKSTTKVGEALYGFNQSADPTNILIAIMSLIPDLYNAAYAGAVSLKRSFDKLVANDASSPAAVM